jgi:cobalt-zinc-cadmium efflux system protein
MSGPHHAHHGHGIKYKLGRLRAALILTLCGMFLEFAGGILSNSLALISDAGHMLTHVFALGTSYFAIVLTMKPATKKRTYGLYRAEVLAAFINGIFLLFVSAYIVYESIMRFISPEKIAVSEMLSIAVIGLVINGTSTALLSKVSSEDLNIKSAFIHEIGDMLSSIAVVMAGIAIFYTKNYLIDPILSLFITILIVVWAVRLLVESANILLESTPRHLDIDEIIQAVRNEIPGVHEIHHIHIWTIATSMYALTAHVVIDDCHISKADDVLHKINKIVKDRFNIGHTNIQFECLVKKDR